MSKGLDGLGTRFRVAGMERTTSNDMSFFSIVSTQNNNAISFAANSTLTTTLGAALPSSVMLNKDEVFGTVEAVKTVSDLFIPLSGEVIEFNESLESEPEKVNSDAYGEGWMIKIKISNQEEINQLLDAESYKELIGE